MLYKISDKFTKLPGGRYKKNGDKSGEQFREEILTDLIDMCLAKNEKLQLDLDDVYGFPPSFLEEAFGGLLRKDFKKYNEQSLKEVLEFIADDEPPLKEIIWSYISDAERSEKK